MENKQEKSNIVFIVIIFAVVLVLVLFLPKIYEFIETEKVPEEEKTEVKEEVKEKTVDEETLKSIHFPIMRNSIYDSNTYYSLDKFTISNMSNNDILYNAFMGMEEIIITASNVTGSCTNLAKEFSSEYLDLTIQNVVGKNVKYNLETFYVPQDSTSSYKGAWVYDSSYGRFIYGGLCSYKATGTSYYNLEELISAKYDDNDIIVNYYVGFAKVVGNNYVIYSDPQMTKEIHNGTFTSLEDLNNIFKSINKKDKKAYKYTFKNTLCSYNEYCLYEGKWVNEV